MVDGMNWLQQLSESRSYAWLKKKKKTAQKEEVVIFKPSSWLGQDAFIVPTLAVSRWSMLTGECVFYMVVSRRGAVHCSGGKYIWFLLLLALMVRVWLKLRPRPWTNQHSYIFLVDLKVTQQSPHVGLIDKHQDTRNGMQGSVRVKQTPPPGF